MTADSQATHSAPQPPRSDTPSGRSPSPKSFALLAKRLSNWTTNSIVTVLVLVLGLGVGRQVIRWWKLDTPNASPAGAPLNLGDGLGDPGRPHEIRFGNSAWRMRREMVTGSREQAVAGLRSNCRAVAQVECGSVGGVTPGEQRLLQSLRKRTPLDREDGKWAVYEVDEHFPMVVGVREPGGPQVPTVGQNVAQTGARVVTWGLAVPVSHKAWTLYTFHPATSFSGGSPEFGLPPKGSVVLSLEVEGGGRLTAVRGTMQVAAWKSFYDRWFQTRGWTAAEGWHQVGSIWSRCYVDKPTGPAGRTDVQFGEDDRGGLSGLVLFTPAPDKAHGK